jgi:hypothetical protein
VEERWLDLLLDMAHCQGLLLVDSRRLCLRRKPPSLEFLDCWQLDLLLQLPLV